MVKQAVQAERDIVFISTLSQKPDMTSPTFMKLLEPIQKALAGVVEIKDSNRPSPLFNNLSTVAEGIPALGWFTCVSNFFRGEKIDILGTNIGLFVGTNTCSFHS